MTTTAAANPTPTPTPTPAATPAPLAIEVLPVSPDRHGLPALRFAGALVAAGTLPQLLQLLTATVTDYLTGSPNLGS